jgi:hypothetical protein
MADQPVVHIGENSREEVAFKLMERIATVEGRNLLVLGPNSKATRFWILQTYHDCLMVVRGYEPKPEALNR